MSGIIIQYLLDNFVQLRQEMAKPKNNIPSVTVTITTTPHIRELLSRLARMGFYGKNPSEAAERLIARTLELMIKNGELDLRGTNNRKRTHEGRA